MERNSFVVPDKFVGSSKKSQLVLPRARARPVPLSPVRKDPPRRMLWALLMLHGADHCRIAPVHAMQRRDDMVTNVDNDKRGHARSMNQVNSGNRGRDRNN